MSEGLEERLATKIEMEEEVPGSFHLIWKGATSRLGYPYMRNGKKVELVSHIMWRRANGKPARRLINKCGRRDCVAPSHFREA